MSVTATNQGPVSATTRWLRGLWRYYRGYIDTAIHAVATAALTGFGLLIFVDPLFAILAIASYLCPPVVLYALDADAGKPSESPETTGTSSRATPRTEPNSDSHTGSDGDSDSDSDDGDSDSDSDDGDSDSDSDDGDTDSDSDDGDTDG